MVGFLFLALVVFLALILGAVVIFKFRRRDLLFLFQDFLKNDTLIFTLVGILLIIVFVLWYLEKASAYFNRYLN